jgi:hypothetical protein
LKKAEGAWNGKRIGMTVAMDAMCPAAADQEERRRFHKAT